MKVFNIVMLLVVLALLAASSSCNTLPISEEQAKDIATKIGNITSGLLVPVIAPHMPDGATAPGSSDSLTGGAAGVGGGIVGMLALWVLNALRKKSKEELIKEVKGA